MVSYKIVCLSVFALLGVSISNAQWRTESFNLVDGWQAIYLRVDTDDELIGGILEGYPQVQEIWRWKPESLDARIIDSPSKPVSGVEWQLWKRDDRSNSNLYILYPNSAYLVKVDEGSGSFTLPIKGRVTSPVIRWRTDGLNLLGFPTNPDFPPSVESFFAPAEIFDQTTEIYGYSGGSLSAGTNPAQLIPRFASVERSKAYWIRSNKYADYDGPLRVRAAIGEGIDFGSSRPTVRVILTNRTDRGIEASLSPSASEPGPGMLVAPQSVPLTRRTNSESGETVYETLDAEHTVALRAGETLGLTLGIDRSKLVGSPGDEAYSLLKVTDSEGLSEFYVPVHAEVASLAGLWVGEAEITQVQNQLQRFQKDDDEVYLVDENGSYVPEYKKDQDGNLILDALGNPIPDTDTGLNKTAQVFRLKLIVHVDESGAARLLGRVYVGAVGIGDDELPVLGVVTDQGSLLVDYLSSAARLSAVHLPKGTNLELAGVFGVGGQLTGDLVIGHDDPRNPFIHTYHPDHDNLDARFENLLPDGSESYRVERSMVLTVDSEAGMITDPSWGTTLLSGAYAETVAGLHKNSIAVEGVFAIRKISDVSQIFSSN